MEQNPEPRKSHLEGTALGAPLRQTLGLGLQTYLFLQTPTQIVKTNTPKKVDFWFGQNGHGLAKTTLGLADPYEK